MKVSHVGLAVALALATTMASANAAAQDGTLVLVDRASSDRADELSKRGLALASGEKKYAEAEALLREAWGLKRSYDIAANLGIVTAKQDKWRDAAEFLAYAFRTFPGNGKPEHKKLIEATLAKVALHVAAVKIKVSAKATAQSDAPVERVEVSVDGVSIGVTPLETVFLDPGQHTIAAERKDVGAGSRVVDVQAGGSSEVELVLAPAPSGAVVPPPRPKTALLVAGGVTSGAALIAGAVFTALSKGKVSDAATKYAAVVQARGPSACTQQSAAGCEELHDALGQKSTLGTLGGWMFVGAGVFAATTVVYGVVASRSPTSVHVTPVVGPQQGGLVIGGVW